MTKSQFINRSWRALVFLHRWFGILACLLFAMWFITGLVMIYVGFPELTRAERLLGLRPIDWTIVRLDPSQALKLSVMEEYPRELRLEMAGTEAVYRIQGKSFEGDPVRYTISAASGEFVQQVTESQALAIAQAFSNSPHARFGAVIHHDQWTVTGSFDSHRPLYRIDTMDELGTQLYVSSHTGEVVLDTTRNERIWNYVGAVTHWFYFTQLRVKQPLWRQIVLWTAGAAIFVAITGVWIGIVVMRVRRRYPTGSISPYRGWMKWHHIAGLCGGLFVFTWIFSGWMSMDPPVPWTQATSARIDHHHFAGNAAPYFELTASAREKLAMGDYRQIEFGWFAGAPRIWTTDATGSVRMLDSLASEQRPTHSQLIALTPKLLPMHALQSAIMIHSPDSYWNADDGDLILPVLRASFDDPAHTWIYLDPATGKVLGQLDDAGRTYRWLFSALHRLDFYWLINYRPLWDIVMWLLSLAGLCVAVSGIVIGWRRLLRSF